MSPQEIRALRLEMGLTQTAFAAALAGADDSGPGTYTIQRWESGVSVPSQLYAYRLEKLQKGKE